MKTTVIVVALIATLLVATATAVIEVTPPRYYGDVTVNGGSDNNWLVGKSIYTSIDKDKYNDTDCGSIEVEVAGKYGGPDKLDKHLIPQDPDYTDSIEVVDGDTVRFYILDACGDKVFAEETHEWNGTELNGEEVPPPTKVDLTFENVKTVCPTPSPTPTGVPSNGDGRPGGGGGRRVNGGPTPTPTPTPTATPEVTPTPGLEVTPTPTPEPTATPTVPDEKKGIPYWIWILIAAGGVGAGAAYWLWKKR